MTLAALQGAIISFCNNLKPLSHHQGFSAPKRVNLAFPPFRRAAFTARKKRDSENQLDLGKGWWGEWQGMREGSRPPFGSAVPVYLRLWCAL